MLKLQDSLIKYKCNSDTPEKPTHKATITVSS